MFKFDALDHSVHEAMHTMTIRDKYTLWHTLYTLSNVMDFELRAGHMSLDVRPVWYKKYGWHLSDCAYPEKRDCPCRGFLSNPVSYFHRETETIDRVLNKGLHWSYCPYSKMSKNDLFSLNVENSIRCECQINLNESSLPMKRRYVNDGSLSSSSFNSVSSDTEDSNSLSSINYPD